MPTIGPCIELAMTTIKPGKDVLHRCHAVLSMDIEDWYHLDYFDRSTCDCGLSLLDGVEIYREILSRHQIPSSFFVVGELVEDQRRMLQQLAQEGHDLGVHGWTHTRPMRMSAADLAQDLERAKKVLEDTIGAPVLGYRAPCYSLDRERLDAVSAIGFGYDSSLIQCADHPLYGRINLEGFETVAPSIYRCGGFFEFELSTLPLLGRHVPVSGGGYLRLLPWWLMRRLIDSYLRRNTVYVLYIHPFELSPQPAPPCPPGTGWATRMRFQRGRHAVASRLIELITLLMDRGFHFTTCAALRRQLLGHVGATR